MSLFDKLNGRPLTMQDIQRDPVGIGREKGYNIPDNIGNNPQAIFTHILQTGQIQSPMLQRLMPMMRRMGIK